jgi:DNA-binding response OmpR family regulator
MTGAMNRVLIVEDDTGIGRMLERGLAAEGYEVEWVRNLETAIEAARGLRHDLVVLDRMLPDGDGAAFCRALRRFGSLAPVCMLTARDTLDDKLEGFDAGADDYLTKPFAFQELLARVRALLRRRGEERSGVLQVADLTLDPARRVAHRGGEAVELTAKEYALLDYFMRNPDRVLTRTMIAEHVWDYDFDSMTNVIDVYVNYLRKKIDRDREPKLIHTVRGSGYVMKAEW